MPKVSKKTKIIKFWEKIVVFDLLMLDTLEGNKNEEEHDMWEEWTLFRAIVAHTRYPSPFVYNSVPKSHDFINKVVPLFDEEPFIQIVRIRWSAFKYVHSLIKDDPVFNGPRSCQQLPSEIQLIIVLYRLGSCGEGATVAKIASLFGISDGGALQIITERVFAALFKLKTKYISWPSVEERRALVSDTMHELPHCIGYVDGTEIKLAEKPSQDPEAYFSRKHIYSVKVQAICDHKLRFRHLALSWPGSVHDSRIYKSCSIVRNPELFFNEYEWLVGDKAYSLSSTIITPFKENSSAGTLEQRIAFNRTFSKYRIRIEHAFGQLKEKFNSLKELKLNIRNVDVIKGINRWILSCAILHNILIKINELDEIDVDFEVDEEEEEASMLPSSDEAEARRRAIFQLMFPNA